MRFSLVSNDCVLFDSFDPSSRSEALGLTFAIARPSESQDVAIDAYNVITSQSLQGFCSDLLGYSVSTITVTLTSTYLYDIHEISQSIETKTSTEIIRTDTWTSYSATKTITVPVRPTEPPSPGQKFRRTAIATPSALLSYPASALSSGCSRVADPPQTITISELAEIDITSRTTILQPTTFTIFKLDVANTTVPDTTTIFETSTVGAYDIITSDGLQDYCTSYLGYTTPYFTVTETISAYKTTIDMRSITEIGKTTFYTTVDVTNTVTVTSTYTTPCKQVTQVARLAYVDTTPVSQSTTRKPSVTSLPVVKAARREVSVPVALRAYSPSIISSDCSRVATALSTETVTSLFTETTTKTTSSSEIMTTTLVISSTIVIPVTATSTVYTCPIPTTCDNTGIRWVSRILP
jgi:hypothetical protein